MSGVCPAMTGNFCVKYNKNKQMISAVEAPRIILSPDVGGNQKVANVMKTIAETSKF